MSRFSDHLLERLASSVDELPRDARGDLARLDLFLLRAEEDPRYRVVVLSADSAASQQRAQQEATDDFLRTAARWSPAGFEAYGFAEFGDPAQDPVGAEAWRHHARTTMSAWRPEIDAGEVEEDEDEVQLLALAFRDLVIEAALALRPRVGLAPAPRLLVTLDSEKPNEPLVAINQQLNDGRMPPDGIEWFLQRERDQGE